MSKRLLVIDANSERRSALLSTLAEYHYGGTASTPDKVVSSTATSEPDVAILVDGSPEKVGEIVASRRLGKAPLLFLDPEMDDARRLAAIRSGARDALPFDVIPRLLTARLRGLVREAQSRREFERRLRAARSFGMSEPGGSFTQTKVIGYVGGSPDNLSDKIGLRLREIDVAKALEPGEDVASDAYVIPDGELAEMLLPELRARPHSRFAPVLVQTDDPREAARLFDLGAVDAVPTTASHEELSLRLRAMLTRRELEDFLRRADEASYHFAQIDAPTGLFNKNYLEAYLTTTLLSEGAREPFTLIMGDVDFFKTINDTHGHEAGDVVLKEVALRLRRNLRAVDLVARYGGEEFIIVLPGTHGDEAEFAANRIRETISDGPISISDGEEVSVTMSFGVVVGNVAQTSNSPRSRLDKLLKAADAELYSAKGAGRNCVSFGQIDVSPE